MLPLHTSHRKHVHERLGPRSRLFASPFPAPPRPVPCGALPRPVLLAVDRLLTWCAERDVELEVVWYPRESALQQAADDYSKHASLSQWQLNDRVFRSLWGEPCLGGRAPTVDAFAD